MTMRSAASLALLGAVLVAIVLVVGFVLDLVNVLGGLIPALRLVPSFIYAFASVAAVVFLYVFRQRGM
jgi:vacuolar-type H+-ATPase subunit I/STV1